MHDDVHAMVAVSDVDLRMKVVAVSSEALRMNRHDRWRLLFGLTPTRAPGLWVTRGHPAGAAVAWSGEWRRATAEEAQRYADGMRVWRERA